MSDSQQAILTLLKHIQERPGMYVAPDVAPISNFLVGFDMALSAVGYDVPEEIKQKVIKARGWEVSSVPLYEQMQSRDMDESAIINELLAIWIDGYEQTASETEQVINED